MRLNEDKTVRANAANVVNKIRYAEEGNQEGKRNPVRDFHPPRCNFAATSYTDLIILEHIGRWNGITYLIHKKGYLVLHEPPFKIKRCADTKQFIKQPLHLTKSYAVCGTCYVVDNYNKWTNCWLKKAN